MRDLASKSFVSASKLDEVEHNLKVTAQQITTLQEDLKRIALTALALLVLLIVLAFLIA